MHKHYLVKHSLPKRRRSNILYRRPVASPYGPPIRLSLNSNEPLCLGKEVRAHGSARLRSSRKKGKGGREGRHRVMNDNN